MKLIDITKEEKEKKETVFTHFYGLEGWRAMYPVTLSKMNEDRGFTKVIYLGKCIEDGDMFAVCYEDREICIYKGIKGNEFD